MSKFNLEDMRRKLKGYVDPKDAVNKKKAQEELKNLANLTKLVNRRDQILYTPYAHDEALDLFLREVQIGMLAGDTFAESLADQFYRRKGLSYEQIWYVHKMVLESEQTGVIIKPVAVESTAPTQYVQRVRDEQELQYITERVEKVMLSHMAPGDISLKLSIEKMRKETGLMNDEIAIGIKQLEGVIFEVERRGGKGNIYHFKREYLISKGLI